MRHVLTDEDWEQLRPLLPSEEPRRGRPWVSHRMVVSGILWLLATGVPWRDLPEEFGKWKTVFNRFRRWVHEDVWDDLLLALYRQRDAEGCIDREQWTVDGTNFVLIAARAERRTATRWNRKITAWDTQKGASARSCMSWWRMARRHGT